jgi:hypothetical protein
MSQHQTYWATCPDCETRITQLEREGLTTSDAQGVAQAEHMKAALLLASLPTSMDEARQIVRRLMPDESVTVIDNVAESLMFCGLTLKGAAGRAP